MGGFTRLNDFRIIIYSAWRSCVLYACFYTNGMYIASVHIRLVLKCGLAHLNANANARDESNANANASAQHLNQMQMQIQMRSS